MVRLLGMHEHVLIGGVSGAMTRHRRAMGPALQGMMNLPPIHLPRLIISGITKDSAGAVLAACSVHLHRTIDGSRVQSQTSDGGGVYAFDPVNNGNGPYYVVAYKAGAPDVAGTTVNTLLGA